MGMATSDDEAAIIAEDADLKEHLRNAPASERLRYERMNDDQKAYYEHSVREKNKRDR